MIEDDVYGFLSPERASLAALIPDRTIFVTSVSKSLFPGMRLGCAVAPPALVEKLSAAVWTTTICVPPISADLLCGWMEDGTALRILEWKRHEVAARQTMAKRLLDGNRLQTQPSSPHVWLHPARAMDRRRIRRGDALAWRARECIDRILRSPINRRRARFVSASGRRGPARDSSRR